MEHKELLAFWKNRRRQIYIENRSGLSYTDLAKKYNLSTTRIYQIIHEERKAEQEDKSESQG